VRGALEKVPGVTSVAIDFDTKKATIVAPGVDGKTLAAAVNAVDGGGRFTATVR